MTETSHLTEERIYHLAFDHVAARPEEERHLAQCSDCAGLLAELAVLADEFEIGRAAEPAAYTLAGYYALADQIQQQPSGLGEMMRRVVAALTWDSRSTPALQGVRSAGSASYRLLYGAETAEIEVMVEHRDATWRLEGDLIPLGPDAAAGPVLVQLQRRGAAWPVAEVESDDGRFRFENVAAGAYELVMTPTQGATILVGSLEIP